jgi:hypothetical protein
MKLLFTAIFLISAVVLVKDAQMTEQYTAHWSMENQQVTVSSRLTVEPVALLNRR